MIAFIAIAGALLTTESPVRPNPTASPSPVAAAARPVKYCIEGTVTGSRIVRRDCRTRAEWMERGFDPLNPSE